MASNQLPPIKTLFSDSWEMLKGSLVSLIVIYVISLALFGALFLIGLLLTVPLGVFSVFTAIQNNGVTPGFFASLGVLGVIIIVLLIAGAIIGTMIQAALILIVANYKNKPSYGAALKQGLGFVLPIILVGILVGFITSGGFLLFVIPGIIFALAFMFVNYEIVLNKKGVISSMKRSMGIVFSNFWGILGRALLIFILAIVVMFVVQILGGASRNAGISAVFSIIGMIANILIGWYGLAYSITLYKQASKGYTGEGSKLIWPFIVAVIGWIVGVIMISLIVGAITYFISSAVVNNNAKQQKFNKELQMMLENPTEENVQNVMDLLPTNSPQRAELQKQLQDYNNSLKKGNSMMDGSSNSAY